MPGIVAVVFWIWFAVAAAILVYRLVTTGSLRGDGTKKTKPTAEEEAAAAEERRAAFEAQLAAGPPPAAEPAPAEAPTDDPVAETTPAPSGTAVATEPEPPAAAPPPPMVRTLAEALEGISMPAGLFPLGADTPDPRHLLFVTDTAPAEAVATGLADELERLGFTLQPLDDRSVAAIKPQARVEVRILPEDLSGVSPLAGRVTPGSVVAEFQLS